MPWVTKHSTETYAPAPVQEQSPQQRRRTWWHYHKGWVVAGLAALVGVGYVVYATLGRVTPDYRVGFVSTYDLPQEVVERLESGLATLGEDVNGDGRVVVELTQYRLGFDEASPQDPEVAAAGIARLAADLLEGNLYVLLLDDPAGFQANIGALRYLDGRTPNPEDTAASAQDWQQMVLPWPACPVLRALDLGGDAQSGVTGQDLMNSLYVGRRAVFSENQQSALAPGERLWQALTAGGTPLPG